MGRCLAVQLAQTVMDNPAGTNGVETAKSIRGAGKFEPCSLPRKRLIIIGYVAHRGWLVLHSHPKFYIGFTPKHIKAVATK